MRACEVSVIGGGPAGAAAACHLARMGRAVTLIEQNASPRHKVCGEFLSHEAIRYLAELEVDLDRLGARPIHGVRLAARRRLAAADLPFPALSLTRRRLDEALLDRAVACGAQVHRGRRVEALEHADGAWSARLADGSTIESRAAFLATGKHDLRGHPRPASMQGNCVAFKMYWQLSPSQQDLLQGWVEVFLFPGGYAGLLLTEDSAANLCLLVRREVLSRCQNDWSSLLAWILRHSEPLAERLDGATPFLPRPLAIYSIPYGLLRSESEDGLWLLGDQTAVIPSFAGDGISIALHSARVAGNLYCEGETPGLLAHRLHRQLRGPMRCAGALAAAMMAAPAAAAFTRMWPRSLRYIAQLTRLPPAAMARRGLTPADW